MHKLTNEPLQTEFVHVIYFVQILNTEIQRRRPESNRSIKDSRFLEHLISLLDFS